MITGDLATIHKVIDQGRDLTISVNTPHQTDTTWSLLGQAAHNGHTHLLLPLLSAGLSVEGDRERDSGKHSTNWTPLMVAARQGHVRMIEELLFHRADPLARDQEGTYFYF